MFNDAQNALLNPLQAIAGTIGGNQAQNPQMQDAAWNGMGQIGALLMAAGQRMTSQERAHLLAGIAPVIGNIPTTALNSAQAQLMQAKATQEQEEQRRQALVQERLSDPAFAQGLGLTPEQATLLGAPGAIEAIKARASHDPVEVAYKQAVLQKLTNPSWETTGYDEFGKPRRDLVAPDGRIITPGGQPGVGGQGGILAQIGDSTGPEALEKIKKLNPAIAAEVQGIVNAKQPFPARKLGTQEGALLNSLVSLVDPNYDAGTYKLRNDMRLDYQKAGNQTSGGQIAFGNVGLQHMKKIYDAADNLPEHTNWGPLNTALNQADIKYQERSGAGGDINSYKLAVINGFDEIAKALGIGTGAGQQELQEKLSAAQGKTAIRRVLKEQAGLLKEKLDNLQEKWNTHMGPAAGDFRVISPQAQEALDALLAEGEKAPGQSAPTIPGVKSIRQIQ
jgi:hypothetical protein